MGQRAENKRAVAGGKSLAVCALLLLAVIVVYGQTAHHDFVNYDDGAYVHENRHVQEGLSGEGIAWAFTETHVSAHWHPLTWLSLMADAQMLKSGEGPPDRARLASRMHMVNAALHAANTLILFLALCAMTAGLWRSALVAAIFAVHPLHVESVAWVTERKDVLSGLFGLLALGAYAWYARRPSVVRYLSVAASLSLGLMAKPMLVTWPFLFLLLDYWPLGRWRGGRRVGGARSSLCDGALREPVQDSDECLQGFDSATMGTWCANPPSFQRFAPRTLLMLVVEKIPLFAIVAASAVVAFLAQRAGGTVVSLESSPISARIARAAMLYAGYLGKSLWPVNLAVYPEALTETASPAFAAAVLLLLLTAGALWGAWRGQRWLAVGWFWYLGTLAPVIGLVQIGTQVAADRFLYLPQIGLCVAMVWGVAHLEGAIRNMGQLPNAPELRQIGNLPHAGWLAAVSALVIAALTAGAWQQTAYWRDSERLWNHALACNSSNAGAHNLLGLVLVGRGDVDEAVTHFRKAVEIVPDYAKAHYNLGRILADRGELDEAIAHYRKALAKSPERADMHFYLAIALGGRGQVDEATIHYRKALEIQPDLAYAHYNLANVLAGRGEVDTAMTHYRKALEIMPGFAEAHYNLGSVLAGCGQFDEAIAHFEKAVEISPNDAETHNSLGLALVGRGRLDEAIAHYRKALEIKPDYVSARRNLDAARAKRN